MVLDVRQPRQAEIPEIDRENVINFEDLDLTDIDLEKVDTSKLPEDDMDYGWDEGIMLRGETEISYRGKKLFCSVKSQEVEKKKHREVRVSFFIYEDEDMKDSLFLFGGIMFYIPNKNNFYIDARTSIENRLREQNDQYKGLGIKLWKKMTDYIAHQ